MDYKPNTKYILYASIANEKTKSVNIGQGENEDFFKSLGMEQMEVELSPFGGWYLYGYAPTVIGTNEDKVKELEKSTGLTRAVRELVLAEGSGASDYVKQQAQKIETLAAPLREASNE